MKNVLLTILIFLSINATGQSTKGITGERDTSFTNYRAYTSTVKTHPGITLVEEYMIQG